MYRVSPKYTYNFRGGRGHQHNHVLLYKHMSGNSPSRIYPWPGNRHKGKFPGTVSKRTQIVIIINKQ